MADWVAKWLWAEERGFDPCPDSGVWCWLADAARSRWPAFASGATNVRHHIERVFGPPHRR